jgi:P27 family predicted phage terminase small subunit
LFVKGRKPIPSAILKTRGSKVDRPAEIIAPLKSPDMPDFLDATAREEWAFMTAELERLGIAATIDRSHLAMYCTVYSRWRQAEQQVAAEGMTVECSGGHRQQHPALPIANKAIALMQKMLPEFGMSPSSRTRLHVKADAKPAGKTRFFPAGPAMRMAK